MITDIGRIIENKKLSEGIYSLWIKTQIAALAGPGQFVLCYPKDKSTLLQRPISICEINPAKDSLRIVFRVAGKGTAEFAALSQGEEIRLLGSCGNGYDIENADRSEKIYLVGGGIGVPPMLQTGKALKEKGADICFVLGYRNADMFLYEDFKAMAGEENILIATDDGSRGCRGTVIDAMRAAGVEKGTIMACGPMPMLKGLKAFAGEKAMKAYISLEERMACGVGACLGCVCKTVKKDEHSRVNNARICVEGPVFDAEDVEI